MSDKKKQNRLYGCLIALAIFAIIIAILAFIKVTPLETYHDPDYGFSLKYPAYWGKVMRPENGMALVIFAPPTSETDKFAENVTITANKILSNSDLTTDIKKFSKRYAEGILMLFKDSVRVLERKEIRMGGLPAYRFSFITNTITQPTGQKMKYLYTWVLRGDTAFIFLFVGDRSEFNDNLKHVNRMFRTFKFEE